MSARFVALVAGVGFFFLAARHPGLPALFRAVGADRQRDRGRAHRSGPAQMDADRGHRLHAAANSAAARVYLREGCWYCHSQYVRPVTGETRRWGPVSEAGEYAFDVPHLFGTRRIGPDLTRVGLKYSDEWHFAHFWNPRMLSPDSIMAPYRGLFDAPAEPVKPSSMMGPAIARWKRRRSPQKLFDFSQQGADQAHAERRRSPVRADAGAAARFPLIWTPQRGIHRRHGQDRRRDGRTCKGLIAYVQKLGMNRGKWRDLFEPQSIEVTDVTLPRSEEWIAHGKEVYERRCLGCHGAKGDGNGPAATFLFKSSARAISTTACFKFRLTKKPMPTDGDLLRTITRGVRGTAMPAWYESAARRSPRRHPVHQI